MGHQHANTPHALALLGIRRKWRCYRAANKRDAPPCMSGKQHIEG